MDYNSLLEGTDVAAVILAALALVVITVALLGDGCSQVVRHIIGGPERRRIRDIKRMRSLLLLDLGHDEQGVPGDDH